MFGSFPQARQAGRMVPNGSRGGARRHVAEQPGKLVYELGLTPSRGGRKLMLMALHEITNYTRACVFCIHYNMSWGWGNRMYSERLFLEPRESCPDVEKK